MVTMSENYLYTECQHCGKSLIEGEIHNCRNKLFAEIEELKDQISKWKTWHDSASEDAKKWRRDAQELQRVVNEIRAELQSRAIHLLSKHCWCEPTGHSWTQNGTVAE
jgi:hypothetical protein